jgi:hypothetical protein
MGGGRPSAPAGRPRAGPVASQEAGEADGARRRLELRAAQLDRVVAALRSQAGRYGRSAPAPLRCAIGDYQAELAAVRRRLSS